MVMLYEDKISTHLCYKDVEKNISDLKPLIHVLEKAGYIDPVGENELESFIRDASIGDYIFLCNAIEEDHPALAFQLRSLLNHGRFQWRWVDDTGILMKSSHSHFASLDGCKADALKHADRVGSQHAKLYVIAYLADGVEFGGVLEITAPAKRKRADDTDAHPAKKPNTYQLKFCEDLGGNIRMQIFLQDDKYTVDIRRWVKPEDGADLKPSKKGIRLSIECFVRLVAMQERVQKFLDRMKNGEQLHKSLLVGGAVYLKLDSPFLTIHIREFYFDDDDSKIKPGQKGIILRLSQWQKIMTRARSLDTIVPNFSEMEPCFERDDHADREVVQACPVCNYFG